ncbi:hypothetical protein OG417_46465 [Actinoallomurus sp. NBC_01490]|uniref:hypothetical protein n=1 Tax=Actinoallomurus sp. NBC_01490 TaxID=2903557 RepID=UPI002E37A87D|nr:hypothetical protein [Actinoallomurus sp. NBC_01490]
MIDVLIVNILLGIVVLGVFAMGLSGLVDAIRERKPGDAFGGVFIMLVAVGLGWAISFVVLSHHKIVPTRVGSAHAVNCTAKILRERDARSRINGDEVYRLRVRVQIPGRASYEADSSAAVSPLVAGGIGADRTVYACRADRDHLKKVEILWDHPRS